MAAEVVRELEARLAPVVEKLITMMGAARAAFNRHSRESLEEVRQQHQASVREIQALSGRIQAELPRQSAEGQSELARWGQILSHLEAIAGQTAGLEEPIRKKIKDGVLFSDKAVSQTNYLFDQHAGLIRSILDIIKTDNEFLKKYVREEGTKLNQACLDFATEHETRLIEGVCLPQAAPIFLGLLERMRALSQREVEIAGLLAKKP
jgi:Na+/phosphate symporter